MIFHGICPYPLGPNTLSQRTRVLPVLMNCIDYRELKLTNFQDFNLSPSDLQAYSTAVAGILVLKFRSYPPHLLPRISPLI